LFSGFAFKERFLFWFSGGIHKGGFSVSDLKPLLWGEARIVRREGNPLAPVCPIGETEKGEVRFRYPPKALLLTTEGGLKESERSEVLVSLLVKLELSTVSTVPISKVFIISNKYQRNGKLNQVNRLRGFRSGTITDWSGTITTIFGNRLKTLRGVWSGTITRKRAN